MDTAVILACNVGGPLLIIISLIAMFVTIKRWVKENREACNWLNDKK
jgi:hypothetical protein